MQYYTSSTAQLPQDALIGGKATNLYRLIASGMPVPPFVVIPQNVLNALVPEAVQTADPSTIIAYIQQITIPQTDIDTIIASLPDANFYAVRSSAIDEDGTAFSFAGQYATHLFVPKAQLIEKIKLVWCAAFAERVVAYRKSNQLKANFGIAVIIQVMIDADAAGVGFGMNPVNGNTNEKIISAVYGLGEGLVSGAFDTDNYILKAGEITVQMAQKTHKMVFDDANKTGIKTIEVAADFQNKPALLQPQIIQLGNVLDTLFAEYGHHQDIEFAIKDAQIYILQTRPITTVDAVKPPTGAYILWDNSNIIESYPGVTTPLTFSFISKSYEGAYKLFSAFMGVDAAVIHQNEQVFANTLGFINGRVYYNLKTWYHMLAMLPGYSINARFMEKMMGVKERFDIPETYRIAKGKAWFSIAVMAIRMYGRFIQLPSKRKAFMLLLEKTITSYKAINYQTKNSNELMQLYLDFERTLLNEWKAPLLNDFFAMIWFGLLQKQCEKYAFSTNPNIHNDLLCGSSDIISTQPIHRTIAIATAIATDEALKTLFLTQSEAVVWNKLLEDTSENSQAIKAQINLYISDFGERCIGELKLETISYTQDPVKFIKIVQSYVETGITMSSTSGKMEASLRQNAEMELNTGLKYHPFRKWKLKGTLKKARELVSARENLRYERTRAFGIVRMLFSHIGTQFHNEGIISHPRDIFYLTKQEIFAYIEGTSVNQDVQKLIAIRKEAFENYRHQEPPSERFATYGVVYHANDFFSMGKVESIEGDLKGVGCCPGKVRATVRVVVDPGSITSLDGDILVTTSTDPGWVTLFPSASGIIVERGSLLSHSAIVSREMGKPCIVSVTGLLKTLHTGDLVEMDGSTGTITIIQKA